jgi:hypothetical protein
MTNPKMPNHPEPEMAWTPSEVSCILTFVGAAVAAERERIAAHFDARDKGCGGFYDAHEPAEIIRAMSQG